jgi:Zn-dependent metalloprotease
MQASAGEQFAATPVMTSGDVQYVPYTRTYNGLPVIGGDFVMVMRGGQNIFNSVGLRKPIGTISTSPSVSQASAEAVAAKQLTKVDTVEGTQLVVHALDATPRLAWATTVAGTGAEGYSRQTVYVDALNGKVLGTEEHVVHGTGNSGWNGNPVTINTTSSGGTFSMVTPNFSNMPCQNATGNATFTGSDDLWGNGNATNRETGCVDALFGAQQEIVMLSQWLGRNGMNGNGGAWPIRVGLNDLNAFYDGTQVQVGHNSANQWIGSMDVIGHEMGHGIDDFTPNSAASVSANGTQEFVADTFGAATEWFVNEPSTLDGPDFTVGERINLQGSGPIRNMANPGALGDPNCYSSSIPGGEVHASAGPGNHWYYLMAEGSNPGQGLPTSPTCNGTTVAGLLSRSGMTPQLAVRDAQKIMYNGMLMKSGAASYLKYRVWTLQAALNLFPNDNCATFNIVKNAWNAVSVPVQAGEPTCGGGGGTTVYTDNFEAATGWTTNPNGTDTATTGQWERNNPQGTTSGITLQLDATTSGVNDLVTAAAAGASAGANDVDGGTTSIQSPAITLPATGTLTLTFNWYLAHLNNATSADFFRVSVVNSAGTATAVLTQAGAAANRAGAWTAASVSLNAFAGQTIRLRVEARDDPAVASLIEAGVDDVRIAQS